MTEYVVKREHFGDKYYKTGDKREAKQADVQHLIDKGVLVEAGEVKPKTTKTPVKQAKPE